jgi:hypothetical protein
MNRPIEEFTDQFIVPEELMSDGILFIWVEKENIYPLVLAFEK